MKYSFDNWSDKSGTVPVTWKTEDYVENTTWYQHDGAGGFTTSIYNQTTYAKNIGVLIPENVLPVFSAITEHFDLKDIVCDLSKYTPGMLLPWHVDD